MNVVVITVYLCSPTRIVKILYSTGVVAPEASIIPLVELVKILEVYFYRVKVSVGVPIRL